MDPAIAADAVLLLHAAFVVWAVCGGFAVLRWPTLAWAHLPAALWGVWVEWSGAVCPLTPLENRLRRAAGEAADARSFIERTLGATLYPDGLTRDTQWLLGTFVLLLNLVVYAFVVQRARQRRRR